MPTAETLEPLTGNAFAVISNGLGVQWKQLDVVAVYTGATLLPLAVTVCIGVDIENWQRTALCEKQTVCGESQEDHPDCLKMTGHIRLLFLLYTVAISCQVSRICLFLAFVSTRSSIGAGLLGALRWQTLERSAAGLVFWSLNAILEAPGTAAAVFRLGVLPIITMEYAAELYPESDKETGAGFLVAYSVWALLSLLAHAVYIPVSRVATYKLWRRIA